MKDSQRDRKILNSRVIGRNKVNAKTGEYPFATFYAKRCGINIDVFRSYLETPLITLPITIFRAIVNQIEALWGK
jgi:hypothetical protein